MRSTALFIGFMVKGNAIGIRVIPAGFTNEVKSLGIDLESRYNVFRVSEEVEADGSNMFHIGYIIQRLAGSNDTNGNNLGIGVYSNSSHA